MDKTNTRPPLTNKELLNGIEQFLSTMQLTHFALSHEGNITLEEYIQKLGEKAFISIQIIEEQHDASFTLKDLDRFREIKDMIHIEITPCEEGEEGKIITEIKQL